MKKIFILFGKEACELMEEHDGLDGLLKSIEDDGTDFEVFQFDPETNNIADLLQAYTRWEDYSFITEAEYEKLLVHM